MYSFVATAVSRSIRLAAAQTAAVTSTQNMSTQSVESSDTQTNQSAAGKQIESSIRHKLESFFEPKHLEVLNESYMHKVPKGSETHFKVVIVSDRFANEPLLNRHRLVNKILDEELKSGVHALSIIAKTPDQWESSSKVIDKSPPCRGGTGL